MPISTLPPIGLTCQRCGAAWETRSQRNAKCPKCGTTRRVHRGKPRVQASPQISGPMPELQSRADNERKSSPVKSALPEPAPAPAPAVPRMHKERKVSVADMQEDGIDPADFRFVPDWNDPEPEPESEHDEYNDSAYEQTRQAQLDAVAGMIRQNSRVQNTRVHPGPTGPFQMAMLPRAIVADFETGSIIGTVVRRAVNRRGRPVDKYQRCGYCGAIPGASTPGLFRVRSPGVEGERILCTMHAQQEALISGTEVITL